MRETKQQWQPWRHYRVTELGGSVLEEYFTLPKNAARDTGALFTAPDIDAAHIGATLIRLAELWGPVTIRPLAKTPDSITGAKSPHAGSRTVERRCKDSGCDQTAHYSYVTEYERRELEGTPWHCSSMYPPYPDSESATRRHIRCALAEAGAPNSGELADAVLLAIGAQLDELETFWLAHYECTKEA